MIKQKKAMLLVGDDAMAVVDFENNSVKGIFKAKHCKRYFKDLKALIKRG